MKTMTLADLLSSEQVSELRLGNPIRITAPELGGDVVLLLAPPEESVQDVLAEALRDIAETDGWYRALDRARDDWARENGDKP